MTYGAYLRVVRLGVLYILVLLFSGSLFVFFGYQAFFALCCFSIMAAIIGWFARDKSWEA